jgi:hypothetical protein
MAEIEIERRTSDGLRWAILGIAALGLLLFWLLRGSGAERLTMVEDQPATETATQPANPILAPAPTTNAAVQQYERACARPASASPIVDAPYTSHCIDMLATAIEGSTEPGRLPSIQPRIDSARSAATRLATEQDANRQAELTREAFDSLAGALETARGAGSSVAAVTQLTQAAQAVASDQPLSAQSAVVHAFFTEFAIVLGGTPGATGV